MVVDCLCVPSCSSGFGEAHCLLLHYCSTVVVVVASRLLDEVACLLTTIVDVSCTPTAAECVDWSLIIARSTACAAWHLT